jgi:tRNA threonylcarbamoyladenosine biosynthesis protein TsaE
MSQKTTNKPEQWTQLAVEADLGTLAKRVVQSLEHCSSKSPFCLWLKGGLGAGKTTFTGYLLRELGLPEAVPVTSPTYTYLNEYKARGSWFAHLDLYRAGPQFSLDDLGLTGYREYAGYVVEWPDQIPESPDLIATHLLDIQFTPDGQARVYTFFGAL